ncbi:hypothetical protein CB1_001073078 [Camelus ferus]|nr:hypothetical protein CB1_001073078 [Camelus ferus]
MATLARLQARSTSMGQQYYYRNSVVDVFRKKENDAAVKIQSWFRGCQVRAYIRALSRGCCRRGGVPAAYLLLDRAVLPPS